MAVPSPSTLRTPDFISPNARRRRGIVFSSTDTPTTNLAENDDAAEKRQRLLSKAISATLQSPATPRSVSRLDSERSQSAGNSVLTNTQLKDLYSNCIKLSTENKINAKNAFGLPLIDYMQDLIKTVKEGDMTNFQVASCTLDASAKIYAGRVDSIHAQAYKMLGGLGMADQNQDTVENGSEVVGEEQQGSRKPKKTTHHKSGNTVETNLKNLNVNQFDLAFEVDPLFHKTSAAFDEGGTGGLLLNHLFVRDDSCELLLDSTSFTMTMGDALSEGQTTDDDKMVDLSELRDVYSRVNFEGLQICSHFTDFEFTNWNRNGENHTNCIGEAVEMEKNDEAFDVNAPALGPECDYPQALGGDYSDDDFPGGGGGTDFGRDGCETTPQPGMANPICNASLAFADGEQARLVTAQEGGTELGYAAASVGTLCLELSSEPSDYSYFKSDLISTWAGPQAWKLRARLTKGVVNGSSDGKEQTKKKRAKKQPFVINFDVEVDVENSFSKRRAATTLSKGTLEKHQATKKTLPEDLHFDADNLFRRFIKPKIMIKRQPRSQTELRDDGSAWYNYDNANDCANYCPDLQDGGDDDDDFNGPDGPRDGPGGNFSQSDCPSTHDMTFGDVTNSSQGHSFVNESVADQTMFAGDGLVAQPNKVQKIDIAYAKTAKKMDVKKLKNAMWGLLIDETEGNKENISGNQPQKDSERSSISYPHSFKHLYSQLPEKLSKNMGKNLSVSIAFVCILHLANEKCLKMTGDPGMGDFTIIQGI